VAVKKDDMTPEKRRFIKRMNGRAELCKYLISYSGGVKINFKKLLWLQKVKALNPVANTVSTATSTPTLVTTGASCFFCLEFKMEKFT